MFYDLPSRARTVLNTLAIPNFKSAVRIAFKEGKIYPGCVGRVSGKKTIQSICEWAGITEPFCRPKARHKKQIEFKCCHCSRWNSPPFVETRIVFY